MKIHLLIPATIDIPAEDIPAILEAHHEFWREGNEYPTKEQDSISLWDFVVRAMEYDSSFQIEPNANAYDDFEVINPKDTLSHNEWLSLTDNEENFGK